MSHPQPIPNGCCPAVIWTPEQLDAARFCVDMKLTIHSVGIAPLLTAESMQALFGLAAVLTPERSQDTELNRGALIALYALMLEPQELLEALEAGEISGAQQVSREEADQWTATGQAFGVPSQMPTLTALRAARLRCLRVIDPQRLPAVTLSPEASQVLGSLIASRIEQASAAGITDGPGQRGLTQLLRAMMRCPPTLDAEEASESVELLLEHVQFLTMVSGQDAVDAGMQAALDECLPAGWPSDLPHPLQAAARVV